MLISSAFESGCIEVVDASDPSDIQLRLIPEPHSLLEDAVFMQWFNFSVSNVQGVPLTLRILNASEAAYPAGWDGYRAVATYDREDFFRVPGTSWDAAAGELTISITPEENKLWLSYFAPYPYQRHQEMITRSAATPSASLSVLGQSLEGRDIDKLTIGEGRQQIWIVTQQHPGEHMAEYWTEGLLNRRDPSRRPGLPFALPSALPRPPCCPRSRSIRPPRSLPAARIAA